RFTIATGPAIAPASATGLVDNSLDNGLIQVRIDPKSGNIIELQKQGAEDNFAQNSGTNSLNQYVYLRGDNPADLATSRAATITAIEKGPLVATLRIESSAPGCNKLTRDLRLVAGSDYVELVNTLDKKRAPINPNPRDRQQSHEFSQHE